MDPTDNPFEAIIDDAGLLPGDADYDGDQADEQEDAASALEDHVVEFDADGNEIEQEVSEDDGEDSASDDAAGDDGDESDSEEDGDQDGADDNDKLYDIEIDGETYEVNLPELQSGYLRNEEFTKRASQLEAEYTEKLTQVALREAELVREIEASAVINTSNLREYENVDWAGLKVTDPEKYQTMRLEFLDKREQIQATLARRGQIQELQNKAAQIKHEAYLQEQGALAEKLLPEFRTPEFQKRLVSYGESIGFTEDEMRGISDARHLLVMDQARQFAESQVRRKEIVQKKGTTELPQVLKPGGKRPVGDAAARRSKAAISRVREEQTINAAAAAFLDYV